nr:Conserved membrane protein [uncultured bacterium]
MLRENEAIAGNRDTTMLKIIAVVCMLIDHVGVRLFRNMTEMRIIGRIAFPLYCWCLVVGLCYTRNEWKYLLRLLIAGIISQPFFMLGLNHGWDRINVFATLFMGAVGVIGIRRRWHFSQYWAPLLALIVGGLVPMDYGWKGVMVILLLYVSRQNRGAILGVMTAFCLYWGGNYRITSAFGVQLTGFIFSMDIVKEFLRMQTLAILALPLILWPRKDRLHPLPRITFYMVYPCHLLLLWIAQICMGLTTAADGMKLLFPWI